MSDTHPAANHDDDHGGDQADHGDHGERLQKYLARCGVASRRHAEELIVAGAVTVNGRVARELGVRVDPDHDAVRVRGKRVQPAQRMIYLLLNKPTGVVTSVSDPEGRPIVLDLLPDPWRDQRVYPVGRLDQYSEGLLLLTNDGALALRLTHPRYALTKEYHALVRGRPDAATLERFARGLTLEGETRPTAPARAWLLRPGEDDPATTWVATELHEGRNRQVRRMFDALGHHVLRLRRVRVGPLTLGDLRPGETRPLTAPELAALRRATENRHHATGFASQNRGGAARAMWRLYAIGFGLMAVVMIVVGAVLFVVTLADPVSGGATPEWVWLVRALVAVVMGAIAATLSVAAWRQAQRTQV